MRPYKKYFHGSITREFPADYQKIINDIDHHYSYISKDTEFSKTSSNPIDKRLDFSAYFLALIITLDQLQLPYESIRRICLDITTAYVSPANSFQRFLKRLPPKLTNTWIASFLFKWLHRKISKNSNGGGFVANIITDKRETYGLGYGVDIIECGICKLFKKHDYGKYASILCEVDELTSALAGLMLIRNSTIALGAKKCDFRFKRLHQ